MTALVVALAVAVLLLGVLVAGLLRSHAEILKALHELGAGLELDGSRTAVPVTIDGIAPASAAAARTGETPDSVTGSTLDDEAVALPLVGGGDTLVAFLSSSCTTCQAFWDAFSAGVTDVPGGARLVVVTRDLSEESEGALRKRAPRDVPVVVSSETWDGFAVPGSPYFVYVDGAEGRVVGEGSAATWPAVADLLGQAVTDRALAARRAGNGRQREARDERELRAAGIGPGDPSLYPDRADASDTDTDTDTDTVAPTAAPAESLR